MTTKFMSVSVLGVAMAVLLSAVVVPAKDSKSDVQRIAEDAYLYGLQQAIFYGQRWISTQNDSKDNSVYTGIHRFSFVRKKITPDFPIVTPNATTLYGSAYFDLQERASRARNARD